MSNSPLRNIALIAHVDHGKTTLVDAMLQSAGVFAAHQEKVDRVMDSNDQERERGITILSKAASIEWKGTKINLVDTPGHADFSGEVERALTLVDGVVLLVDAAEGPMPQTRYVLSKALALHLPTVLVINKIDRSDARPEEVADEVYELFFELDAGDEHIEFPILSAVAREGRSMRGIGMPEADADLSSLLDTIVESIPAPTGDPDAPLQALVTNLDASDYLGRIGIGRVVQGTMRKGDMVSLLQEDGSVIKRKLAQLQGFEGVAQTDVSERSAGDLFAVAGFGEVEIGDTFGAAEDPVALQRLKVDEPVLRMTFGVNTSPMAGLEGKFLTSRQIRDRLEKEVLGNVSIKLGEAASPEEIQVAGRGELQLAVLIESMRREGFELQVSRPRVVTKEIDGKRNEPTEKAVVDVPDQYVCTVTQAVAPRMGRVNDLRPDTSGRTIVEIHGPSRGLLGFRGELMTATRGTALLHQRHTGWMPWVGDLPTRSGGAIMADRRGSSTGFALDNLQKRGEMFVGPNVDVYEGMIIGEASRPSEMVVNVCKGKQLTNIRTHASDDAIKLKAHKDVTLEVAMEWITDDELIEVTPASIRVRKRHLTEADRKNAVKK